MSKALNFQQLILRLHQFWSEKGCLIWQPYSEKVGAGTMNPATVISVLGPEPWNVAYAEPSYRPDDGRFGENPNRMQMHTQYQVILKPDPGNPQELYLESLRAIGIDTDLHDIRFVEDNWESPALGAWGLGWEVWLDGLEITQFTYFQQAASHVLDLPAVEITYGLERIAIFLQGVRQVWDLAWDSHLTYGEVLLQNEIDHCKYDFEVANVDRLLSLYGLYEQEARSCIEAGLVVPAHDSVLRCSHTFNVLDARGAIGVTERAAYFGKMRDLSRQVADAYLKQREEKGFPLSAKLPPPPVLTLPEARALTQAQADFVLEVGVEELPPDELVSALAQLETACKNLLADQRLEHATLSVSGTARRLVVQASSLAARQPDRVVEVKGPPAQRAFDAEGKPTQTALGFAKSNGLDPSQLQVKTEGDKSYVVAQKHESGQTAAEVLAGALPKILGALKFRKSMRWDRTGASFSRPVRWLLCLHGDCVIPFAFAGCVSGATTRGPRPLYSQPRDLSEASQYSGVMSEFGVIVEREARRQTVLARIQDAARAAGGEVQVDPALLEEVTDLVECPVPVVGNFEPERLTLPAPVLTTVMKKHQRYFPVTKPGGSDLMPCFVTVCNGQRGDMSLVRQGNEDVLRARYADAAYFVQSDVKNSLAHFMPRLATLTFQEKLGSMLEKSQRVEKLAEKLGAQFALNADEVAWARRAAHLCKADLVTSMVVEMTSLQGVLGEIYALQSGEPAAVALAIREHYLPRFAGDSTPTTNIGRVVGLADRLDSLAGLFSVGLKPTGSADPYGLRRIALGLVALLAEGELRVDLREFLDAAVALQPGTPGTDVSHDAFTFVADRLSGWLKEHGLRHDVVEAAVAARGHDPYGALLAARELSEAVQEPNWSPVLTSYARCKRIVKDVKEVYPLAPELYLEDCTQSLYRELSAIPLVTEVQGLVSALERLVPRIQVFFDGVLVNAQQSEVRTARLALVQRVASLADGIADFSKLEGF